MTSGPLLLLSGCVPVSSSGLLSSSSTVSIARLLLRLRASGQLAKVGRVCLQPASACTRNVRHHIGPHPRYAAASPLCATALNALVLRAYYAAEAFSSTNMPPWKASREVLTRRSKFRGCRRGDTLHGEQCGLPTDEVPTWCLPLKYQGKAPPSEPRNRSACACGRET